MATNDIAQRSTYEAIRKDMGNIDAILGGWWKYAMEPSTGAADTDDLAELAMDMYMPLKEFRDSHDEEGRRIPRYAHNQPLRPKH